jgi:hypothetical protein
MDTQYDRDLANPPEIERERPGHWLIQVTLKRKYTVEFDGLKAQSIAEAIEWARDNFEAFDNEDGEEIATEAFEY